MAGKSVLNMLQQQRGGQQQYGYQNPAMLMNNLPNSAQMPPSNEVINPSLRGSYYGRVFDPQNAISGGEMNNLGWTRRQDI